MRKLGIILAAGQSTRLYPSTLVITKQLLPVYDKPLIYYPLSTLMLADIKDFIIIVSPSELDAFKKLFENVEQEMGIKVTLLTQSSPKGIADAFNIAGDYLQEHIYDYDMYALVLGDNIFYGSGFGGQLKTVQNNMANIFLYSVQNPIEFGIAEMSGSKVLSIEEKPSNPKSNLAITGLYFYPPDVFLYAKQIKPSARGELEISDLNNCYLKRKELNAIHLLRGIVWFDTGNPDAMFEATNFIQNIQRHQNYLIGSPHEIAINKKWVDSNSIQPFVDKCKKTKYGQYLDNLLRTIV